MAKHVLRCPSTWDQGACRASPAGLCMNAKKQLCAGNNFTARIAGGRARIGLPVQPVSCLHCGCSFPCLSLSLHRVRFVSHDSPLSLPTAAVSHLEQTAAWMAGCLLAQLLCLQLLSAGSHSAASQISLQRTALWVHGWL